MRGDEVGQNLGDGGSVVVGCDLGIACHDDVSEGVSEGVSERVSERVGERVSERVSEAEGCYILYSCLPTYLLIYWSIDQLNYLTINQDDGYF